MINADKLNKGGFIIFQIFSLDFEKKTSRSLILSLFDPVIFIIDWDMSSQIWGPKTTKYYMLVKIAQFLFLNVDTHV